MKWIISNHKEEMVSNHFQKEINSLLNPKIKLIICPNDRQLTSFQNHDYLIGSQDVNYAFNIEDLKKMSVKYTLVGHSDKRKKYKETNQQINQKIKQLLQANICPILCIGEEQQEISNIKKFLENELQECLEGIKTDNLIIAYEPIWAIGSGKIPNEEKLTEIIDFIKCKVQEFMIAEPIVVYGGSVNEETIKELEKIAILDGYLIGSASVDINRLKNLIEVIK